MTFILEATYRNGTLILDESLGIEKEGKKFKVILVEEKRAKAEKARFFKSVEKHAFTLPQDYEFDREEIHGR